MRRLGRILVLLLLAASVSRPPGPPPAGPRQDIMVGSLMECGGLVRQARPVYPREAGRQHIEGVVRLSAVIGKTGEPREIQVVEGNPALAPAALAAVRQWRYAPCKIRSEAVEWKTTIDVGFTLSQ